MNALILLALFLSFAKPVSAYLDPGTGSYIAQILIASFIGVGYLFRSKVSLIKDMILGMFSGKKKEEKKSEEKESK